MHISLCHIRGAEKKFLKYKGAGFSTGSGGAFGSQKHHPE